MTGLHLSCLVFLLTATAVLGQNSEEEYDYYYYSGDYSGDYYVYTDPPPTPSPLCPGLQENYDLCSVWYYGDSKIL